MIDELLIRLMDRIGEKADRLGTEGLTEAQRHFLLPLWAQSIVGNGGFEYFFEGASNILDVADSFEALGYPEAAAACRKSVEIFPEGLPHLVPEVNIEWMDAHSEEAAAWFEPLFDPVVYIPDLDQRALAYLKEREPELVAEAEHGSEQSGGAGKRA